VLSGCWTRVERVLDACWVSFLCVWAHVGRMFEEIYIQFMLHNIYFENSLRDNFNFHQILLHIACHTPEESSFLCEQKLPPASAVAPKGATM